MNTHTTSAKRRRGCLAHGLRVAAVLAAVGAGVLTVGFILQQVAVRNEQANLAAPGQRLDVGGYRLHLWCMGESQPQQPTVILAAGIGRTALDWSHVLPQIAATHRVCAYDRAGYGWSDGGPAPRSLEQHSRELHALLGKAGTTSPLVLVGHSYGGALVQQYAALYPDSVAAMLLVDTMHQREWANQSAAEQQQVAQDTGKLTTIVLLNRFGLLRMASGLLSADALPVPIGSLAPQQQAAYGTFLLRAEHYETWLSEIQALQGALPTRLPHAIPLTVLTARQPAAAAADAAETEHFALQADLLTLSPSSSQIIVDAGHDLPLEQPAAVVQAIQALLR